MLRYMEWKDKILFIIDFKTHFINWFINWFMWVSDSGCQSSLVEPSLTIKLYTTCRDIEIIIVGLYNCIIT